MLMSFRSFRHALMQPAGRVGAGVAAVAFCAMLPSPAAAQPTLTAPSPGPTADVVASGIESAAAGADAIPAIPAGIAVTDTVETADGLGAERARTGLGGKHGRSAVSARKMPMQRVVGVAAAQTGDPYVYGAAGPNAFDCSGLTSFAYRVGAGKRLPHSSSAQRAMTARISRAAARPGDLVFFHSGSGVYHVGIFAGGNSLIHSSKPGVPVSRSQIWTSAVSFGRVR